MMCILHVLACSSCSDKWTVMQNLESCPRYYTQNGQYCENPDYDYVFYECDSCLEKKVSSEALHKTT